MAHEIAKIDGEMAMTYLGELPWHRIGTPMTGHETFEEVLKLAHLDWSVELQPMFLKRDGKIGKRVPKKRAIVRDVDGEVLSVVGGDYSPIQNSDAFGVLREAMTEHGVKIEAAGALGIGDRVWMLAKLPHTVEPVKGDKVEGYFLVVNGFNGWTPYIAKPTPIRVVCQNTLTAALGKKGAEVVRLKHVKTQTDTIEQVGVLVTNLVMMLKQTGKSFAQLAAKKLTPETIDQYIDAVLGIEDVESLTGVAFRRRETMRHLVENGRGSQFAPGTMWAAYNAVTEYVDHVRTGKADKTFKQADQSALFGPNSKLKAKALDLALTA